MKKILIVEAITNVTMATVFYQRLHMFLQRHLILNLILNLILILIRGPHLLNVLLTTNVLRLEKVAAPVHHLVILTATAPSLSQSAEKKEALHVLWMATA